MMNIECIELAFQPEMFRSYLLPGDEGDWEHGWRLRSLNHAFSGKTWKEVDYIYCNEHYDMFSALPAGDVCKMVPVVLRWMVEGRNTTEIIETLLTQFGITNRATDVIGFGLAQRIAFPGEKSLWRENRTILLSSFREDQVSFFVGSQALVEIAAQIDLDVARARFLRWSMRCLRR